MRKKGFKIVAERRECLRYLTDLKQDLLVTYSMSNTQESSGGNHKILSIDEAFEKSPGIYGLES